MVTGSVREAVEAVGISAAEAWQLRLESPDFAEYWDKSLDVYRSGLLYALVAMPAGDEQLQ